MWRANLIQQNMIKQNPAHIYLASAREQRQNCWSTFNFGENKNAFGSLFLFNYQILIPNQRTLFVSQTDSLNYILPLYGGINFKDEQQNEKLIATEEIKQIVSNKEANFEISNPFDTNVSYLQIGFKTKTATLENELIVFDFKEKNKLIPLFENYTVSAFIAHFDGRKETRYQLKNKENGIYVFIIRGAFEFENRLLETGDALSIKEIACVEWEALSADAILMVLEIPLDK
jgi:quercetin 2,3-dioxygenase